MANYRRAWYLGGTYFFTINLLQRRNNDLLTRHIQSLRTVVKDVRSRHPFAIHGWVVLPDHIHCVIELPQGDSNFALRLKLIKSNFSKCIPKTERVSASRKARGERGIWQRRYWEHLIRDEADFEAHMNYVHINPVKHGLVKYVKNWPYSTFHHLVGQGVYSENWAGGLQPSIEYDEN